MLLIELRSINEQLRVLETPTTVIDVPESESLKTATSPVQTASGKDSTNPLKAEVLLKSLDNTDLGSSNLNSKLAYANPFAFGKSKMTSLGTNTLVQEPAFKPDYLQAAKSKQERFYVIYKGPRAGIYTNWGEVHKICQEDRSTNKKFSNIEQAQMEFHIHGEHGEKTKINPVLLRPKINPKINRKWEEHRDHRIKISEEPIGLEPISLYNFVEGADSRLVYQAFRAGLVNNIYPSNNLLEIKDFPKAINETIKHFRKKVLKAQDKPIYIKIVSSIPDWDHEENYSPYHFMEIGLANPNTELQFSKVMTDVLANPFLDAVQKIRNQGLKRIAELILQTITEENKKVNYADSHCIIISHKNSTEEDINLLNQFGLPFLKNTIEAKGTTKEAYCRQARQLFEEHSCIYCTESKDKEAGPSTPIKAVPTTEDESSSD
ncbi:RNA-directed DNA polymerase, eukaryota, reverse transcriptase zinc-binding domain protein [Tanacetum coccineum]